MRSRLGSAVLLALLASTAFAGSAFAQCTDPGTSHAITGNFSVELYGPVDTRPGTWGHADSWVWQQPFTNVPAGCRVQILRISGALISWSKGAVPAGTYAGVLVGAYSSAGTGSTRAAYAADGYFMYYQARLSNYPIRIPFNQDLVATLSWVRKSKRKHRSTCLCRSHKAFCQPARRHRQSDSNRP